VKVILSGAAAAVLALAAWAIYAEVTEAKAGYVTDLDYDPAYTTTTCTTTNRVTTCTPTTHPECYGVEYVDGDESGDDCAAPATWDDLELGDWYEQP
jgi:hypothetical protein